MRKHENRVHITTPILMVVVGKKTREHLFYFTSDFPLTSSSFRDFQLKFGKKSRWQP